MPDSANWIARKRIEAGLINIIPVVIYRATMHLQCIVIFIGAVFIFSLITVKNSDGTAQGFLFFPLLIFILQYVSAYFTSLTIISCPLTANITILFRETSRTKNLSGKKRYLLSE